MSETVKHVAVAIPALQDWSEQKFGSPFSLSACHDIIGALEDAGLGLCEKSLASAAPELLSSLRELYATVRGECPQLLNEDSGGNGELEIAIVDALAKAEGQS